MFYRQLGKTGLQVSEIGLGTGQIGGPSLIRGKYIGSPRIKEIEAKKILSKAFDAGVTFYDTADTYGDGRAERLLGEVFHCRRSKVVIATKCGITSTGERCFEKKYISSRLEESLKNLKTDYVDIFQLNKPPMAIIASGELYTTFEELKRSGKIRFSGISSGSDEESTKLVADNYIDTLQIFYNLLHVRPNGLFIDKAFDSGIGLIVKSPLSSGMLTGKFDYSTIFAKEDDRSLYLFGETLKSRVDMVDKIVKRFHLQERSTILELALNYLLSNKKIATVIPGASKASQLSGILKVCDAKRMSEHEFKEVEEFVKANFVTKVTHSE